ncbi:D-alanyl-D-alanine carboxypeptidase [Rubellimicrobium mesophilum DSM 19309]|uniref:D-alanyl-D-alanine carboxypeptidase n=1 Tax=Rubellimicrobium mesophilum DSM 19309 TaxID=442562 RepID=A0A017HJL5_9RHOB|nr:D-alanyl-D-alanine carboxypeptidase [Rubellimicrobium mesophilum DSM 19309]
MGRRFGLSAWLAIILIVNILGAAAAKAAPYAAFVMDARTGQIFYSENAETPLHPASLTKMMTLYLAFQAIQQGEISLDTEVRIAADAADEPPSRLGLREGQTIRLRYLLRAAAVKSANDAAMAIGYAIGGSREGFAARMNAMAAAMGMTGTHFMNPNGLDNPQHLSTARDMSILGRHLVYDFPQYYNLFSRRTADAGIAQVSSTNRRFLDSYEGADGIKTGFTNGAGYNLVASAQRGEVRIIATVFGGTSTADRNARVAHLLDIGFSKAPAHAEIVMTDPPVAVVPPAGEPAQVAVAEAPQDLGRVSGLVETSLRPMPRPGSTVVAFAAEVPEKDIEDTLAEALAPPRRRSRPRSS